MPSVSEFVEDEAVVTIHLGRNKVPVSVRYRPSKLTTDRINTITEKERDGELLAFCQGFEDVVIDWEIEGPLYADELVRDSNGRIVQDEDGNDKTERKELVPSGAQVPIRAEILSYLPQRVLFEIWRGMSQDVTGPNQMTGRGSRRR